MIGGRESRARARARVVNRPQGCFCTGPANRLGRRRLARAAGRNPRAAGVRKRASKMCRRINARPFGGEKRGRLQSRAPSLNVAYRVSILSNFALRKVRGNQKERRGRGRSRRAESRSRENRSGGGFGARARQNFAFSLITKFSAARPVGPTSPAIIFNPSPFSSFRALTRVLEISGERARREISRKRFSVDLFRAVKLPRYSRIKSK